jgi:drug/metabolite transporter (DMT)-like permease
MNTQKKSLQQIHLAVLLFGLAGLLGKMIFLPPALIVLGRVAFASLALLGIISISGIKLRLDSRQDLLLLALLGLLLAVHWLMFFQSIQISTVAVALLSYSTFPVFAALLEPLFDEKISLKSLLLALTAFLGAAIIVPSFDLTATITRGVLWGILSGFAFALLAVFNRKFAKRYSGLVIVFYEDMAAALILLPTAFLLDYQLNLRALLLLAFLGILSTAVAHSLFIGGMRNVKARTASIIATLEPVYGILFAMLLLKEIPSTRTFLGGILIVGAAALASRSEKTKTKVALEIDG